MKPSRARLSRATLGALAVVPVVVFILFLFASPTAARGAKEHPSNGRPMSGTPTNQPGVSPGVPAQTVADVTASVGLVRSAGGTGSGWIAAPNTVITNLHVAKAGSGDIYVDFSDGQRVECYSAVANRDMDLAVVRCETGLRAPSTLI